MTPEQAWQATLGQLQTEMPRATFDTWVREARFISFEGGNGVSGGTFTIGLANAYARDWVESRLTSTIGRMLAGILNQQVEIDFVVPALTSRKPCPEAAWEAVFDHLQGSASTINFDRYLKGARFLAYYENRFIIGLPTVEARDWVAETVNGTSNHMLAGLMREPVEIQFVVAPPQEGEDSCIQTEPDSEGEETPGGKLSKDEADILIKPIRTPLYETITRPKSVVVAPAYLLRWLPFLGPDKGWFLIAMRQRYYQTFGKKVALNHHGQVFTANRQQIARWSGLGKNLAHQFLQELEHANQEGNFLAWFMQSFDHGRGKSKTYSFRADMPLTPTDIEALQTWLLENGIQETPVETLQLALEKQPREILPYPAPPPAEYHLLLKPNPCTVQDIVLATAGISKTSPKYLPIKRLADGLQQHLQSPADNLLLTHYFLLEWLPKLGRTPAWIITILRDRGFIDHNTGVRRDRIKLEGGYSELAQLLNISERQIRDWLPALESMVRRGGEVTGSDRPRLQGEKPLSYWEKHQAKRNLVGYFLDKSADVDWSGNKETTYEFKVKLEEPLIPEHQEVYDLMEELLYDGVVSGDLSGVERLRTELDGLVRESDNSMRTWYANRATNYELDPRIGQPDEDLVRESDTLRYANRATETGGAPRFARLKALLIKHLYPKALLEIKQLLQQHLEELRTGESVETEMETDGAGGENNLIWNWEKLLGYGGLSAETRTEILQKPEMQTQFLGQVLYGYENKAIEEGKGIKSPFKYAEKHRHERPLPEYIELATLPPGELAAVLKDWQRYGPAYAISDSAFRLAKALRENEFLRVIEDAAQIQPSIKGPSSHIQDR